MSWGRAEAGALAVAALPKTAPFVLPGDPEKSRCVLDAKKIG